MNVEGFAGGFGTGYSRTVNAEQTINLIVESDSGTPKRKPVMINRPGLVPWTYISPGPVRAMFNQDGRMFAVSGGYFYELFQSRNVTIRGAVAVDSKNATISSNGATAGDQLFITSGGNGYIFTLSANTFEQVTDTDLRTPIWGGAFLDSYFLALNVNANTFQLSGLLDGLSWNGLDVGETNQSSDAKIAMIVSQKKLWLQGTKTTEVWYDSGDAGFPLQPYLDSVIEHGTAAPFSSVSFDNTVYFVGGDAQGTGLVWRFNGYTPERVSTYAVDRYLQQLPTLADAIGSTFQVNGHAFYSIYSPHADTTLMYDRGENVWTEWAHWHPVELRWRPFVGRCQAAGWGQNFIGDRQSGCIYTLDPDVYTDDLVVRHL